MESPLSNFMIDRSSENDSSTGNNETPPPLLIQVKPPLALKSKRKRPNKQASSVWDHFTKMEASANDGARFVSSCSSESSVHRLLYYSNLQIFIRILNLQALHLQDSSFHSSASKFFFGLFPYLHLLQNLHWVHQIENLKMKKEKRKVRTRTIDRLRAAGITGSEKRLPTGIQTLSSSSDKVLMFQKVEFTEGNLKKKKQKDVEEKVKAIKKEQKAREGQRRKGKAPVKLEKSRVCVVWYCRLCEV
ncbi:protein Ycf2-like [Cucumis melo var. makuwa]|uniref:Protein Ycf2-like n=1 Tax=Cucumis melo var. makuwa TaxID=1194695 RepID=A0A5D3BRZ7_CUCMM|nr:protein Ycf2-like [Cucumis melo var. makuwa]